MMPINSYLQHSELYWGSVRDEQRWHIQSLLACFICRECQLSAHLVCGGPPAAGAALLWRFWCGTKPWWSMHRCTEGRCWVRLCNNRTGLSKTYDVRMDIRKRITLQSRKQRGSSDRSVETVDLIWQPVHIRLLSSHYFTVPVYTFWNFEIFFPLHTVPIFCFLYLGWIIFNGTGCWTHIHLHGPPEGTEQREHQETVLFCLQIETPSGTLGPFCGKTPPPSPFLTHSNHVKIHFTSDGFGTNKGFTLHFKTRGTASS